MDQCGDHQWAPGGLVCIHLIDNPAQHGNKLATTEGDHWLCDGCFADLDAVGVDDLKLVCMHCVRALQARGGVGQAVSFPKGG
jgi:hypothetical protein